MVGRLFGEGKVGCFLFFFSGSFFWAWCINLGVLALRTLDWSIFLLQKTTERKEIVYFYFFLLLLWGERYFEIVNTRGSGIAATPMGPLFFFFLWEGGVLDYYY